MNEGSLQKLLDLVAFDRQTLELEKSIKDTQSKLLEHVQERQVCFEGVERAYDLKKEKRKEVDEKELEMKALDERVKATRNRVEGARNQREYDSAHKELEELNKEQVKHEDALLKAWKEFENAEQLVNERRTFCDERVGKLDVIVSDNEAKLKQLGEQLEQHKKERAEKMKGIPEDLLEKYLMMYDRVEDPIVPLNQSICSSCFYSLPQPDIHNIRRGKLVQCKDCFRFLYFVQETKD